MRKGIHGIVIENRKILVVKKRDEYILPGGKIEGDDFSNYDVLKREFREELSGTEIVVDLYYDTFSGITPNKKTNFVSETYFCYPFGEIGEPSSEIREKLWVNSHDLKKLEFSDITKKVLGSLIENDLID